MVAPDARHMMRTANTSPLTATAPDMRGDLLLWAALLLTLVPQFLRATTNSTSFPVWDQDPLIYSLSAPATTPAGSILIDGLSLLGASLLFARARLQRVPLNVSVLLLALIGAIAVVLHGWVLGPDGQPGSLGDQRIGASWLAGIASAAALWHAAQDPRVRRIVAGTLLGFTTLLALYGVVQVYFLHAQTLADFNANPDRFLAAHGWSRDSSMAKSFVRRLSQPEASAWFGLSNVYASFAAASVVAGVTLVALRFLGKLDRNTRSADPHPLIAPSICVFLLLSSGALYLAQSKGGTLAAIGAFAGVAMLLLCARRLSPSRARSLATLLGLAALLGPIVLILIRGQIGEKSHELSLLFRSFYAEASARIVSAHPILGVGPDGFQRAFTLVKPPLCPEEVSSPHCITLDYLADLGMLGLAWVLLLARLVIGATRNAVISTLDIPSPASEFLSRSDLRLVIAIPIAATLVATFLESPFITPELAAVRVIGLLLWSVATWAIARAICSDFSSRLALAGAAIALIAHAGIDVTASFPISASLCLMLIAIAAAPYAAIPDAASRRASHPLTFLAIFVCVGLSVLTLSAALRARAWEAHLARAAEIVRPIPEITDRLAALARPPSGNSPDSLNAIVRDLRTISGNPAIQPTPESVNAACLALYQMLLPQAAAELERASLVYPDDRRPLREASRLYSQLAAMAVESNRDEEARAHLDRAVRVLRILPDAANPPLPSSAATDYHWLASVLERRANSLADPAARGQAITARLAVASLDPNNLDNALKLFRDYQALGDRAEAARWAARALVLHDYTRLDRATRGLSPADLADVQTAAKPPASP